MKEYAAKLSIFLLLCDRLLCEAVKFPGMVFLQGLVSFSPFRVSGIQPFMRGPKTWGSKTGARLPGKC